MNAQNVHPNHPETQPNEHFVWNSKTKDWPPPHLAHLKTLRMGNVAYDINGNELSPNEGMRPVFIGNDEYKALDDIMMKHTFG